MTEHTKYLLDKIHSTDRKRVKVNFFKFPCEAVMLDFIGAERYIVMDFGAVWFRPRIFTNTFGILTKGCEPMVCKDAVHGYRWVNLETSVGKLWFPINQLVGWAFDPQTNRDNRYYVSDLEATLPIEKSNYKWVKEIPFDNDSLYCRFMKNLYE